MSMNSKEKAPKECLQCGRWKEVKEKIRIAELLAKTIKAFEERLTAQDFKPTIAEYLKLVQLEQESEQETTKEIKVTWIEPKATADVEK